MSDATAPDTGVPNAGQDVSDATEPAPEYEQLGDAGNPFSSPDGTEDGTAGADGDVEAEAVDATGGPVDGVRGDDDLTAADDSALGG